MKKAFEIIKNKKIIIIVSMLTIFVGIICIVLFTYFKEKNNDKIYENDNFLVKYDSTWSISKKDNQSVTLKHNNASEININYLDLDDNYAYDSISELSDKIKVNIEKQNSSYNLIAKDNNIENYQKYDGYKLLFENGINQSMVVMLKYSDKLVILTLNAENKYFDILLNSFENIVYYLKIKDENIDFTYELDLKESQEIIWNKNEELDKTIIENFEYKTIDEHFIVNYSIPSIFEEVEFNSKNNKFKYIGNELMKSLYLETNVEPLNIYEFLENLKNGESLLTRSIKNNNDYYKNINESIQKIDIEQNAYIYRISYETEFTSTAKNDDVYILYELSNNKTFIIKLQSKNFNITKKLIDNIIFINKINYADYIEKNINDGYLINEMKLLDDDNIYKVILYTPADYSEIDRNKNFYEERIFGYINILNEIDSYEVNIRYRLVKSSYKQNNISNIFSFNGHEYNNLNYIGNVNINDKNFERYECQFNENGTFYSDILLFYKLSDNSYIEIIINNKNNYDIALNELIKFDVNIEKRK